MRKKLKRMTAVLLTLMMVLGIFVPTTNVHAEDAEDAEDIYFSDRDVEGYHGGYNNVYSVPLYIINQNNEREIAYCIDGNKIDALAAPGKKDNPIEEHDNLTKEEYIEKGAYYTKTADATLEQIIEASANKSTNVNQILKVLYNGYPYKNNDIQIQNGLSDVQFRAVTQAAIYTCTNSDNYSYTMIKRILCSRGFNWTREMDTAYYQLIDFDNLRNVPESFKVDLYKTDYKILYYGAEYGYQNLISTRVTLEEHSYIETTSLTIKKELEGEGADDNQEFTFLVKFTKNSISNFANMLPYSINNGEKTGTIQSNGSEGNEIKLKGGDTVVISNIPVGATYEVTEVEENQTGYTTTKTDDTGVMVSDGNTATFVNKREMNYHYDITATKQYNNGTLKGDDFTFELLNEKGQVVATAKNDKDGNIVFSEVGFPWVGNYTYTVREVDSQEKGVTYDKEEKSFDIEVTDNGINYTPVTFVNSYEEPKEITVTETPKENKIQTQENKQDNKSAESVKTGDDMNMSGLVGMVMISIIGLFFVLKNRKENA